MRRIVAVALLSAACAPADGPEDPAGAQGAELRVSPAEVRAGGEAVITLVNRSDAEIGYNLCPAALDGREAGEWAERPERPAEVCTMELRVLPPGETADYTHRVPPELPAGNYRFRVGIELPLGGGRAEVASGPFRVI